jgi:hypothetical protein
MILPGWVTRIAGDPLSSVGEEAGVLEEATFAAEADLVFVSRFS